MYVNLLLSITTVLSTYLIYASIKCYKYTHHPNYVMYSMAGISGFLASIYLFTINN